MPGLEDITAIVVNYRTPILTVRCVESFLEHYPDVKMILVDNGSNDASTEYIRILARQYAHITSILNPQNRYHGPALDQGIRASGSPFVLTLDSDCFINRGDFLEEMLPLFAEPRLYAVGKQVSMNRFGYEVLSGTPDCFPYIRPSCMLLDRLKYLGLKRFFHHGSPCIRNMRQATQRGYQLYDFPVHRYVHHEGRGTCSLYGYGLGIRHTIEYLLYKMGVS